MKRVKLFLGLFIFSLMLMPFVNVKALDYGDEVLTTLLTPGESITLNAGDTLTVADTSLIGEQGYINLTDGTLTIANSNGRILMTLNGTADSLHEKNLMFFTYGENKIPIDLIVTEESTLDITGNMALTTGAPVTLTNNGTVNVKGALEIRTGSTYTGTGVTNIYGSLAFYATEATNLDADVTLYEGGNVYSGSDITDKVLIGEANTAEYTYEVIENEKSYTSVSPDVSNNFGYGYTLNKVTVTETKDETKEEIKDEEENPKTADSITITLAILTLGLTGIVVARKKLA